LCAVSVYAAETESEKTKEDGSRILVTYFSRAGENWQVGVVEKGNTEIMAEILAETLGADLFKIETVMEYPESYDEMLEVATSQRESDE
jgi:flavodoxin